MFHLSMSYFSVTYTRSFILFVALGFAPRVTTARGYSMESVCRPLSPVKRVSRGLSKNARTLIELLEPF